MANIARESVKLILTSPPYQGVADYTKAQRLSMEWFGFEIEPLRRLEMGARSKRHRRSAKSDYLAEMRGVLASGRDLLQRDGWLVLVMGESAKREAVIDEMRMELGQNGFLIESTLEREISPYRAQMPSLTREQIIVARRI